MTPPTTPTPGAKRAAEAIFGPVGLDPRLNDDDYADVAAIIDRETGARELLDAVRVLASIPISEFGWGAKPLQPIHSWNGVELNVGHVLAARLAIAKATEATL
jgi:hypothetical protein